MKLDELRKELKSAQKEEIIQAAVYVYKQLKKAQKEEIDDDLLGILHGDYIGMKTPGKKPASMSFDALRDAVEEFVENANEGLYYYPNRTVNKTRRSNWRHELNRYYNQLTSIAPENAEYEEAGKLLWKLYWILGRGSVFHTFVSDDPFDAAKLSQNAFFELLASRFCTPETSQEDLGDFLFMFCGSGIERWILRESMFPALADRVKDADFRQRVIDTLEKELSYTRPIGLNRLDLEYEDFMSDNAFQSIPELILYLLAVSKDSPKEEAIGKFKQIVQERLAFRKTEYRYQLELKEMNKPNKNDLARLNGKVLQSDLIDFLDGFAIADRDDLWMEAYEELGSDMEIIPSDLLKSKYEKKKNHPSTEDADQEEDDDKIMLIFR